MIDASCETLIALSDVPARLPKLRGGKRPHRSCIFRWAQRGCRGVVLETLQVGGTKCTSVQALQRFFERLSVTTAAASGDLATTSTAAQRNRRRQLAQDELERAGA